MKTMDEKPLLAVLSGKAVWPPPIWLMRQAGRYLPEYRALRAKAGSFWTMCMDPVMATEITLQPIRRFGFDGAIVFSDILTVPYALGCDVTFTEGEGPSMAPVNSTSGLAFDLKKLAPTYETLHRVRTQLSGEIALIGFAGAPWTLATYMAAGRGGDEQRAAKLWVNRDAGGFGQLLDLLGDCVARHLTAQLDAGADAVQIFDSWAGGLSAPEFTRWVIEPTKRIVESVRAAKPDAKIIGFPRAATLAGYAQCARETGVNAISLDSSAPMDWAARELPPAAIQGNLDPVALLGGGDALRQATDSILKSMRGKPFIFNLGHGVLPETPLEHVAQLVAHVKGAA